MCCTGLQTFISDKLELTTVSWAVYKLYVARDGLFWSMVPWIAITRHLPWLSAKEIATEDRVRWIAV